VARGGVEPPTP